MDEVRLGLVGSCQAGERECVVGRYERYSQMAIQSNEEGVIA